MTHVDLILPQSSKNEITTFLEANHIRFSEKAGFSISPTFDQVLLFIDSLPWESIAAIIVAWIAKRPSRRVKFTFVNNTCIDATNYSTEELKELLSAHKQVNLFLEDKDNDENNN
ncbi:hypothetical protein MUJ65_002189 [Vibrio vulnificus]|nr:hypothetical protein [Vibrio vulnificus]